MCSGVWSAVRENLILAIECFKGELERCETLILEEDWETLYAWMQKANTLHEIL